MKTKQQKATFWISLDMLSWDRRLEGSQLCENMGLDLVRPYQLLQHAEDKLIGKPSELDLVDIITTLKTAAFHRKASIERHYELRKIPVSDLPTDSLERLSFFGLVRPLVLRTLIDIRNHIEHSDGPPPDLTRCKEILEYVWYFLRSTDPLMREVPETYLLGTPDHDDPNGHWVEVSTGPTRKWRIEVRGWLPDKMVTKLSERGFCLVQGQLNRAKEQLQTEDARRNSEDAFIDGNIQGPREALIQVYRHYFS